jgi:glycerophosphoryl diester phosphodiesterase
MSSRTVARRGYEPELTFAPYDLALKQGADVLKLDLRATADGDLVLVHDATLLRTANDPRRVDELTGADIDALHHPAAPVTFDAFLRRYGRTTRYLVDLKEPSRAWEGRVVASLEAHGVRDCTFVQSFALDALARLHAAVPTLALMALYRRADSVPLAVADIPPFVAGVGLWHKAVDAGFVASVHARGLAVYPWTVNETKEATRLLALGVDAVVTDAPDVVVAARDAEAASARRFPA